MTDDIDLDALLDGVAAGAALLDAVDAPWLYEGASRASLDEDVRAAELNPYGPDVTHLLLYDRTNEQAWVQATPVANEP